LNSTEPYQFVFNISLVSMETFTHDVFFFYLLK